LALIDCALCAVTALMRLVEPYSRPAAILIDEFDAGSL
jgi:hypothetical protein